MNRRFLIAAALSIAATLSPFVFARADIVLYGSVGGSNVWFNNISESSPNIGGGIGGVPELFGAPTSMSNTLVFMPQLFDASSVGTGISMLSSQLNFTIDANPGYLITGVRVEQFGDYTISTPFAGGMGLVASSANAFFNTPGGLFSGGYSFFDTSTTTPGIFGVPFSKDFTVNFAPTGSATFSMNNVLAGASFGPTDASFINNQGALITVFVQAVPEPSSSCAALAGVLFFLIRRRGSNVSRLRLD